MRKHQLTSMHDPSTAMISIDLQNEKTANPEKLITPERAITYYNNFYRTRILRDSSDSTRAVWFDFQMLDSYFQRVLLLCQEKKIEISRFVFLLGAENDGRRTVLLAPAVYDAGLDIHRAFSIDNNEITYLNRFPGENYSTITNFNDLHATAQSLILSCSGLISSAKAIELYNNYYDHKTGPFSPILKFDTRFVSYELGEFEGYLNYLKTQSQLNAIQITGVNIVFGAVNDSADEAEYANHITLFFAPTLEQTSNCVLDLKEKHSVDLSKSVWKLDEKQSDEVQIPCLFNVGQGAPPPPHHWD